MTKTVKWNREHYSKDGRFYISAECIGRTTTQQWRLYDRATGASRVTYTLRDAKRLAQRIVNPPAPPPPPTREQLVKGLKVLESNFHFFAGKARARVAEGKIKEARWEAKAARKARAKGLAIIVTLQEGS
jgi:hypothetical protein